MNSATIPQTPIQVTFGVKIRSDGECARIEITQAGAVISLTHEQALSLARTLNARLKKVERKQT